MASTGVPVSWLEDFLRGDAVPDVIGVNHYVTSDRFLDYRTGPYPRHWRGGNERESYMDAGAVRAAPG